MGEVVRRIYSMLGRWVNGGAVTPAFANLCELAGVAFGAPPELARAVGVSVGAFAGSAAEELVDVAWTLHTDRAESLAQFAATAEAESGVDLSTLLIDAARDRETLALLATAAESAARTHDEWKIDLLARIFVHGARESVSVAPAAVLVDAVRQIERPHLRVIRVLATPNKQPLGSGINPARRDDPRLMQWSRDQIAAADPGLRDVIDGLLAKLSGVGMAFTDGRGAIGVSVAQWRLTELGWRCVDYLNERGRIGGEGCDGEVASGAES